jgi:hypothetical protein
MPRSIFGGESAGNGVDGPASFRSEDSPVQRLTYTAPAMLAGVHDLRASAAPLEGLCVLSCNRLESFSLIH